MGLFIRVNFSDDMILGFSFDSLFDNTYQEHRLLTNSNPGYTQVNKQPSRPPDNFESGVDYEYLVNFALEKINEDRQKNGMNPVALGSNMAAQNHADDMLALDYFSHWNSKGAKPYVAYTSFGGQGYVQENIAAAWCKGFSCKLDPVEQIRKSQYSMMYDDEDSNWGHKNTILNPHHTHVNIGIAYDNNSFYYVQHFETKIIDWRALRVDSNVLILKGVILDTEYSLDSVLIYRDDILGTLTGHDLENLEPYNAGFYDQGQLVGVLVEKPPFLMYYEECEAGKIALDSSDESHCVRYQTYDKPVGSDFEIREDVTGWLSQPGLYTIYVNMKDSSGNVMPSTSLTLNFIKL